MIGVGLWNMWQNHRSISNQLRCRSLQMRSIETLPQILPLVLFYGTELSVYLLHIIEFYRCVQFALKAPVLLVQCELV